MHQTANVNRRKELTFLDAESQRSLVNLLPESFAKMLRHLWEGEHANLLSVSEHGLRKELRRRDRLPGPLDEELRFRFWHEFNRVQDEDDQRPKMEMHNVLGRAISKEQFYKFYITDPYRLAWLLCPPADYSAMVHANLMAIQYKISEIIQTPHMIGDTGHIHADIVDRLIRIMESLHNKAMALEFGGGKRKLGRPKKEEPGEVVREIVETSAERLKRMKAEMEERRKNKVEQT
jgi:hypothetical protein